MPTAKREGNLHAGSSLPITATRDYSPAWRTYALRRGLALFLLFGWVPASVAGFVASRVALHLPWLFLALSFAWGGAAWWAIWHAGEFRCPRCRRRFGALGSKKGPGVIWRGLFDRVCYNCKLRKFENA